MNLRRLAVALAALGAAFASAAVGADEAAHLRWRPSYGDALLEAKIRNVPVYLTRHKDDCGRCERMYRSVLRNGSFTQWANDHVIPVVTHDGLQHEEKETTDAERTVHKSCSLYPGIACRDHIGTSVDADNARGEGLVKIPFVQLCPNTWLVLPTDEAVQIAEEEQFDASKTRKRIEATQEKLGKPLTVATADKVAGLLATAQEADDAERWKDALTALAGIEAAVGKEPVPAGLRGIVEARLTAVEEDALYAFEHLRDDAKVPDADKRARLEAMRASLDVAVLGKRVPTFEAIGTWLAGGAAKR